MCSADLQPLQEHLQKTVHNFSKLFIAASINSQLLQGSSKQESEAFRLAFQQRLKGHISSVQHKMALSG